MITICLILAACAVAALWVVTILLWRLVCRHRHLVAAVKKLMLAWPMDEQERNIPTYIIRDLCLALLDEPEARRIAQDHLIELEDRH